MINSKSRGIEFGLSEAIRIPSGVKYVDYEPMILVDKNSCLYEERKEKYHIVVVTPNDMLFDALRFRIEEPNCVVEPIVVSSSEYGFKQILDREKDQRTSFENMVLNMEYIETDVTLLRREEKNRTFGNKYIKRKSR